MKLYNEIKYKVWKLYHKPSAHRSGMLVKLYRESGGRYSSDKDKDEGLPPWFASKWLNQQGEVGYRYKSDVYRSKVKVSSNTPTTLQELTTKEIERAQREKAKDGRVDESNKKAIII